MSMSQVAGRPDFQHSCRQLQFGDPLIARRGARCAARPAPFPACRTGQSICLPPPQRLRMGDLTR
jgi:hypothetical protein